MERIPKEQRTKRFSFTPRIALATASALVVAGLVGTMGNFMPTDTTPLLTLSAEGNRGATGNGLQSGGVSEDASAPAKADMMWYQPYNYIYLPGDSLSKEAGTSYGYKMTLPENPESFFNKIAKAFGMSGDVTQDPYGYDKNYYVIGDYKNYTGEILGYSHTGAGYWNFSNSNAYASMEQYPEECMTSPMPSAETDANGETKFTQSDECLNWRPTPPKGLPSEKSAIEYANKLFSAIYGTKFDFEVYSDEYTVSLNASQKVDGVEAGLNLGISWYGSEITYAYGFSATPQKIENLQLISAYNAVERAKDYRWWGYSFEDAIAYPMLRDGGVATTKDAAVSEPSVGSGESSSGYNPDAPIGDGEVSIQPVPEPGAPAPGEEIVIEDKEVTLTAAKLKLLVVYAADGSMWLLPGYVYEVKEKLPYMQAPSIIAVDEALIKLG